MLAFLPLLRFLAATGLQAHCNDIQVHVSDPDPNGLRVRTAPDRNARIIGILPTTSVAQTSLHLDSSVGGWVHFRTATLTESEHPYLHPVPPQGWVAASMVSASPNDGHLVRGISLHKSPKSTKSLGIIRLQPSPSGGGEINFRQKRLLGCQGDWIHIEGSFLENHIAQPPVQGWLAPGDYCGSSLTTCP
jgi:hypothetical protein